MDVQDKNSLATFGKSQSRYDPLDELYFDPVSGTTRKAGWLLSAVAFAGLCVSVFGIKIQTIAFIPVAQAECEPAKNVVLSFVLIGLLAPYMLRACSEVLRKKDYDVALNNLASQRASAWIVHRKDVTDHHEQTGGQDDSDEYESEFAGTINIHRKKIERKEFENTTRFINSRTQFHLREIRFWSTLLAPLIFGLLVLWIDNESLFHGMQALWDALFLSAAKLC
jgi:hypothetical protein